MPETKILQDAVERARALDAPAQRAFAEQLLQMIDVYNAVTTAQQLELLEHLQHVISATLAPYQHPQVSGRRIYYGEYDFMRNALGMDEEQIARVMAEPADPEPGEEYEHADL